MSIQTESDIFDINVIDDYDSMGLFRSILETTENEYEAKKAIYKLIKDYMSIRTFIIFSYDYKNVKYTRDNIRNYIELANRLNISFLGEFVRYIISNHVIIDSLHYRSKIAPILFRDLICDLDAVQFELENWTGFISNAQLIDINVHFNINKMTKIERERDNRYKLRDNVLEMPKKLVNLEPFTFENR
jgi:hypothetical protein